MTQYLVQRLALIVPTLLGVSILVAALVRLVPGGAESLFCQENCTPEQQREIRRTLGLDRPFVVQYASWLAGAVRGDLGRSYQTRRAVSTDLRARLPVTFQLGAMALAIALLIAVPVGVLAAMQPNSALDQAARGAAIALLSVPGFWIATVIIAYGGNLFQWAPPLTWRGLFDSPADNLGITLLPALILGVGLSGVLMRLIRAQMLEVLTQDYVRTARAKGLGEASVIVRHALRNALIPVVTLIGLQAPVLVGGSVILETIFNVPGIGRYLVNAISQRDFPIIQGVNLVIAAVVVGVNLAVDVAYSVIDPRVRYS